MHGRCDLLLLLRCCAASALLCVQTYTHILAKYRDFFSTILEKSVEGKEANRALTDTCRLRFRETCTLATLAAGQLRAREVHENFGRPEYIRRLHEAVSTRNIPLLASTLSSLNEALANLLPAPVKSPPCVVEALQAAGGTSAGRVRERPTESLGSIGADTKRRRKYPPTPYPDTPSDEEEEWSEEEGASAVASLKDAPQPDGPPPDKEHDDADVEAYLNECLSPSEDFSLSPRE